jgi:hypothetical protein
MTFCINIDLTYWHASRERSWRSLGCVAALASKTVGTHQILVWPFCREFGQSPDVATAKKTKRRRQRIDALLDVHVWLRKNARIRTLPGMRSGAADLGESGDQTQE